MGYFEIEQPREPNLGRSAGIGLAICAAIFGVAVAVAVLIGTGLL